MKKITSMILAAAMSLLVTAGVSAREDIKVTLNGSPIYFDEPPIIRNERTLVPIRAIFEAMDMFVSWDEGTKKILAIGDGYVISMTIGGYGIGYGSSADDMSMLVMDVAPCIINDRTYVPVRYIAEITGYNVEWNGSTNTVAITGSRRQTAAEAETNEFEVKGSYEFYSDFNTVLDFGKLNALECIGTNYDELGYKVYKYTATGLDVANYIYAIKALGYELINDPVHILSMYIFHYEKDGVNVKIVFFKHTGECSISMK